MHNKKTLFDFIKSLHYQWEVMLIVYHRFCSMYYNMMWSDAMMLVGDLLH